MNLYSKNSAFQPRLAHCAVVALLCSCAATSVKETWKSPGYAGGPLSKAAVLAVDERGDVRRAFENRLAAQIQQTGATGIRSYELLSLAEIDRDKQAAGERLRATGAEAVVVMRLADSANFYREVRPGPERYAEVITGYEPGTWYDYYSVAYSDWSPTYGNLKQKVYLETAVFDLRTAKRLWSGLTLTVVTERMDRVAELDPLIEKIVSAMRKDGILR
jgi:hypothetical protein